MRVLIVADVVGGVRTFAAELTRGLVARDVEVHLLLLGRERIDTPGVASCELRDLQLEWMHDPWDDVSATARWIEERRRKLAPDVIHMNTFAPVLEPSVPVVLTVHSCVLTWWRAVHGCDAPEAWARYSALVRGSLRRCALMTTPTRALRDELAAVYGELPQARAIPNGRAVAVRAATRERLVVSVGRLWDQAKNADLVSRAEPAIDGQVVLIGPGEGATGPLSEGEVLDWLSRATVFSEPARYEPFGLAALEAALCGCALVLGDIPSLREVWADAATFVSPDDPDELAAAVNAALADPTPRAAAARARAARYAPAAMADAYLDAYRAVVPAGVAG
jgi:glycosyltransferase involved in cell wall biosynthesis